MVAVASVAVTPRTGTGERYATAMGELWAGLSRTLVRLESVASEPDLLDEEPVVDSLRRLQYALHVASEHAYGLRPPEPAAEAHADLAASLAAARDVTAEVSEAAAFGGAIAVEPLLHQWRAALFRVRLARMELGPGRAARQPPAVASDRAGGGSFVRPLVAFVLALLGALAFVVGATTALWPVWAAGLAAVAASVLAYRP